jgi:hypothetical protein
VVGGVEVEMVALEELVPSPVFSSCISEISINFLIKQGSRWFMCLDLIAQL